MSEEISYEYFDKVDMRLGKIVDVLDFPEARDPAYKLKIDFGSEIGEKWSSSQITDRYEKSDLMGKLVVGVINFPAKRVAGFKSEVLTLGFYDTEGKVILAVPDKEGAPLGERLN